MTFSKNQDVISTLAANASDKSFTDRIRFGRAKGCFENLDARACSSPGKMRVVPTDMGDKWSWTEKEEIIEFSSEQ
jgi:hypothetical protein